MSPATHRTVLLLLATCTAAGSPPAQKLTADDEKALRTPFAAFDRNGDGAVAADEFPGNPALFAAMDKDRDGKVTFDEYKVSTLARRYLDAVRIDLGEPRKRVNTRDLAERRLRVLDRFDKNRDGRITKDEWTGPPEAFLSLDLDRNGMIDKRDRAQATAETEVLARTIKRLPDVRATLPSPGEALQRYDKDGDETLDEQEIAKTPYARFLDYADRDGDRRLDRIELNRIAAEVNDKIARRDQGQAAARAPNIPFTAWDKDDNRRLDLKEWQGDKALFRQMDLNRDAAVTPDEILRYKRAVEGSGFLEKFDLNGDRKVTREEFAGPRAAFDRADRNGDGVITRRDG